MVSKEKISEEFKDVPDDPETNVLMRQQGEIGGYKVLFEYWIYKGIGAVSAIFIKEDVHHLSDKELQNLFEDQRVFEDGIIISRAKEKYIFVNYSFRDLNWIA